MTFGSRLKKLREDKGLSQEALGKGLGTNGKDAGKSVVYGWEKGKKPHYPRADQLALICSKLGCSADFLLFGTAVPVQVSPEAAQLAQEIDTFHGDVRKRVIHLCKETISFVRGLSGGVAPEADQPDRKHG